MNIKEMRQRKADLVNEARTLCDAADDDGNLTEDQNTRIEAINKELDRLNVAIGREERLADHERSLTPIGDGNAVTAAQALDRGGDVTESRFPGDMGFATFGEQLLAVVAAEAPGTVLDPRLQIVAAATGAGGAVPSDGGFLVQVDFATEVLRRMYDIGQVSSRVMRLPVGPNSNGLKIPAIDEKSRVDGSRWGGIQAFWTDEGGTPTATRPKLRMIEMTLKKLMGLSYVTDELLQDAVALEALTMQGFSEELNFKVEDAIVNGDGAGKPLGFMNSKALITIAKETGQEAKTIVVENVLNMWARMWGRSRQNAVWLINQDIEPQLYTFGITVGVGGAPVFMPAGGLSANPFSTILGRPIIPIEYAATLGSLGDITLVDLSQYRMIDKGAIQTASSVHVRFIQDEMTFRFIYRVDGQPSWSRALTPKNGTNTLSPFVALAARA